MYVIMKTFIVWTVIQFDFYLLWSKMNVSDSFFFVFFPTASSLIVTNRECLSICICIWKIAFVSLILFVFVFYCKCFVLFYFFLFISFEKICFYFFFFFFVLFSNKSNHIKHLNNIIAIPIPCISCISCNHLQALSIKGLLQHSLTPIDNKKKKSFLFMSCSKENFFFPSSSFSTTYGRIYGDCCCWGLRSSCCILYFVLRSTVM